MAVISLTRMITLYVVISVFVAVLILIVEAPAIAALWGVSDQIVQNSHNTQLQTTYETSMNLINGASDIQDNAEFG
jgi:hypothetical protein